MHWNAFGEQKTLHIYRMMKHLWGNIWYLQSKAGFWLSANQTVANIHTTYCFPYIRNPRMLLCIYVEGRVLTITLFFIIIKAYIYFKKSGSYLLRPCDFWVFHMVFRNRHRLTKWLEIIQTFHTWAKCNFFLYA